MSVPKPRKFTYYERVKSTLSVVQDPPTKALCADLLSFLQICTTNSPNGVVDFTSKASNDALAAFLLKEQNFFPRLLDEFAEFSAKGEFDLISKEGGGIKSQGRRRALIKFVEQNSYQALCMCSLACPVEAQKCVITKLFTYLRQIQPDKAFRFVDHCAWVALMLMINPVRLKQQCDGSIEMFELFREMLGQSTSGAQWTHLCLKGTIQLAFGVSIKYARNSLGLGIPHDFDEIELVNEGVNNMAFEFLLAYLVRIPSFSECTLSVDVIDSLIKNFICYFRSKLVEMYNLCEEELYSLMEGPQQVSTDWPNASPLAQKKAPNFGNLHFKTLLELIGALYEPQTEQLKQHSQEFIDPNCEGLNDFICKGKAISAPALKVAYLSMLTALCKSAESADVFFNLFK